MREFLTVDFSFLDEETRLNYLHSVFSLTKDIPKEQWFNLFKMIYMKNGSTFCSPFTLFFAQYMVVNGAVDKEFEFSC